MVHSATKYLGGHSDVVGGFAATNDPEIAERIGFLQNAVGAVPSPFDCYLVLRGLKTLAVRMDRHCANAQAVATLLVAHPAVSQVLYPGLPVPSRARDRATADARLRRHGVFLAVGGEDAALELVATTRLFTLAESLGGVESLIEHPARMTHASAVDSPLAVDPALVRLSVGIETTDDLVADLHQALDAVSNGDADAPGHATGGCESQRARRMMLPTASVSTRKPSWPEMVCTISTADDGRDQLAELLLEAQRVEPVRRHAGDGDVGGDASPARRRCRRGRARRRGGSSPRDSTRYVLASKRRTSFSPWYSRYDSTA